MGDIGALAASIAADGLLHPVVVTAAGVLVAGERRIRSFQRLGRVDIPARVVDLPGIARGEYAENFFRKEFTPSEAVVISEAIAPAEKAKAKERQRERTDQHPAKFSGSNDEAAAHVGKAVGISRPTLAKAAAVVEAAKQDPARYGKLQDQMDATGNVSGAHKKPQRMERQASLDAQADLAAAELPGGIEIRQGDCLKLMAAMPEHSVDGTAADP
jgi:ParB-like chromosome segregation protein Spo0J